MLGEDRYQSGSFPTAAKLFDAMMTGRELPEFLTLSAYEQID
jgi:hypothetical protein